jgi:hypothetical protein
MIDPELETFKTTIDLRAYAAGLGYVWQGELARIGGDAVSGRRQRVDHRFHTAAPAKDGLDDAQRFGSHAE